MLLGLQTNNPWSPADFGLVRPRLDEPAQFQSAKLYFSEGTKHNEGEVRKLRELGISHFVLRLSETFYAPDEGHPTYWLRDPIGYAEDCLRVIARFVRAGVYDYILGPNEPNIYYADKGIGPARHAAYMRTVLAHMKGRKMRDGFDLPDGVRVGLPPIAWTDEWPHMPWLEATRELAELSDLLYVHSYWQSSRTGRDNILAGPLNWERFGGNYRFYQGWCPGKPIMCVEFGNSIHEKRMEGTTLPLFTPQQVEAFRIEQYPIWLELAEAAGVEAAHVFISDGSTPDWAGFRIGPHVARVMAHSLATPRLQGQSRRLSGGRFAE